MITNLPKNLYCKHDTQVFQHPATVYTSSVLLPIERSY